MENEESQQLTDKIFLLQKQIEDGRVIIADHLIDDFLNSLRNIRLDANGLVISETVDARIRSMANAVAYFKYREDAKNAISLFEIQRIYFNILETNFGHIYKEMRRYGIDEHGIAIVASKNEQFVTDLLKNIGEFLSMLRNFWHEVSDAALFHIQDLNCLKAIFGGDLFPSYSQNIASTAGLYVDTIVLPCPIIQMSNLIDTWKPKSTAYFLVKHALSALKYKELALAEVTPPIIVILPSLDFFNKDHSELIRTYSERSIIKHSSKLFGEQFNTVDDVTEYMRKLDRPEDVISKLKCPERLLFDTTWKEPLLEQLRKAISDTSDRFSGVLGEKHAGQSVFFQCIAGRMQQAAAAEMRSVNLRGTPLIDADTSWNYLTWKMEYDSSNSLEDDHPSESMHIVHALQYEHDNNLSWLGNVPPESIIELRKKNLTDDVRSIISKGVPKLIQANPRNFFRTSDQVIANLDESFRSHQQEIIKAKNKKLKLFGLDVTTCIALGGISVAAAITANPVLGAAAGILGAAGLPNLRDIKTKFKSIREEENKLRSSPTGILFRHIIK